MKSTNTPTIEQPSTTAPTPLLSVADVPSALLPTVTVPTSQYAPVKEHARRRVENGARGTIENHETGNLGEYCSVRYFGDRDKFDNTLRDNGDGGVDFHLGPASIDVKTAGQGRESPALTVDAHGELRADYYALAHRIGETSVRLLGYAHRQFVANTRPREGRNGPYYRIP